MALVGAQFVNAVSPVPVGSLQAFAGANAPTGWLLCDGTSYSTSVYPDLFSVLGYTYGGSSGNFNVPDLRGRMPIGAGNDGTAANNATRTRGDKGGDTRMPQHLHNYGSVTTSGGSVNANGDIIWAVSGGNVVDKAGSGYLKTANNGSGTGENMPPFLVTNYIIKALTDVPRQGMALGTTPPIVTALPVNPQFGEVVTYAADATNGVYWDLQYDASGTYPWKFIGGGPLTASSTAGLSGTISNTGFVAGTPDLAVALPLSGDYWTTTTALATNNTAGAWWMLGLNGPGSAVVDQFCARVMQHANGNWFTNGAHSIKRTFTSSGTVQMQYRVTAGIATIAERGFSLTPIRVAA